MVQLIYYFPFIFSIRLFSRQIRHNNFVCYFPFAFGILSNFAPVIARLFMLKNWWKFLGIALIYYTLFEGLLGYAPKLPILEQSIRNLYFHVPMWFSMVLLLLSSTVYSIRYLGNGNIKHDIQAAEFANAGLLFGVLGLITGMIWAKNTWGTYWTNDPKLNSAAIGMLIYLAYKVLRDSMEDTDKKARISAVYSIFAFPVFVVLIFVLPRLTDSLHPGNGGNPGFNAYDLDNKMRMIFYPSVIGWTLLGAWMATLRIRIGMIEKRKENI